MREIDEKKKAVGRDHGEMGLYQGGGGGGGGSGGSQSWCAAD